MHAAFAAGYDRRPSSAAAVAAAAASAAASSSDPYTRIPGIDHAAAAAHESIAATHINDPVRRSHNSLLNPAFEILWRKAQSSI